MATNPDYQPPPTWAPVILNNTDPATGEQKATFNPVWLSWFVELAALLTGAGGGSGQLGNVVAPATPTVADDITTFADVTGKLLKDSGIKVSDVVIGPATTSDRTIAIFDGTTGKLIQNGLAQIDADGNLAANTVQVASVLFADVPATPLIGMIIVVTDSTTDVWGDTITGSGGLVVLGFYDGTNWTVIGK